jgi:UDP-N-acetylmuramoyl-tripeptide--D-alanyl-D-alanine ligase
MILRAGEDNMSVQALWALDAMASAMQARRQGPLPASIGGISIDSRTLGSGDAFFAIAGDNRDGHDFVDAALQAGAGLAVVSAAKRDAFAVDAPLLVVDDVLEGLRDLARAARARFAGKVIAVTGSVGKTSTKEALRLVLSRQGKTHASAASYNNHWGVPLSLSRCPADANFAVFELGMNHAGEIGPLSRLVQPDIAIITTIAPVHIEFFESIHGISDAKAEIFEGLVENGVAILNRDNEQYNRLCDRALDARVSRVVGFGEESGADARLIKCMLQADTSTVQANILGDDVTYKLGAPGKHLVMNSLAVLAAAKIAGADLAVSALALSELQPASGRGTRIRLDMPGGHALLIDESYNANPVSMVAALALLGQAEPGSSGRRIAVLGDMLELGERSAELHAGLAQPIVDHGVDLVFCAGPGMRNLWEALPSNRRGGYANDSGALEPRVLEAVSSGDVIMIKGSNGSRMTPIVKALQRRFAPRDAMDAAQG